MKAAVLRAFGEPWALQDLAARSRRRRHRHPRPMHNVNPALDALRACRVQGRTVLVS